MLRLYLRQSDHLAFWETWEKEGQTCVHFGRVGERGETLWFPPHLREAMVSKLASEVLKLREKGYEELAPDEFCSFVVQYPADVVDAAARERIEALLDEALGWTGNGLCDGSESGSGRVDLLCAVVDTQAAVETIVTTLRNEELLKRALLAASPPGEANYAVLWPADHIGAFVLASTR